MASLASALRVLQIRLRSEGIVTVEEFVQLQVRTPNFITDLFSSDAFRAKAEAETAAMVARSIAVEEADAAARLAHGFAMAEAEAARARASEAAVQTQAEAEAARAEVEAARAEAETARAEAAVARDTLLAVRTELDAAMAESAMVDVVAEETLASYERRLWAARERAACELEVLCAEVAAADRAACELEVLRAGVAPAEERGVDWAETTIGFFADQVSTQVATKLQPLLCPAAGGMPSSLTSECSDVASQLGMRPSTPKGGSWECTMCYGTGLDDRDAFCKHCINGWCS